MSYVTEKTLIELVNHLSKQINDEVCSQFHGTYSSSPSSRICLLRTLEERLILILRTRFSETLEKITIEYERAGRAYYYSPQTIEWGDDVQRYATFDDLKKINDLFNREMNFLNSIAALLKERN